MAIFFPGISRNFSGSGEGWIMKKITFILLAIFITIAANAGATPLLGSGNASGFTIIDRHQGTDIWSSTYDGYYNGSDYTGYYLGTVDSNQDTEANLETLISYYFGVSYDIDILEKIDAPDSSSGVFSVTYNNPATSGTWSTESSSPAVAVTFYTVKASTEYSLYYVDPALQVGDWVTYHLLNNGGQIPEVSHISASLVPADPIPEPATILLFSTGLVGLVGAGMRKKRK
jgi:PEP-CTERM motif